jgi:hypothetical protein
MITFEEIHQYYAEIEAIQHFDQLQPLYTSKVVAKKSTVSWLESKGYENRDATRMMLRALSQFKEG